MIFIAAHQPNLSARVIEKCYSLNYELLFWRFSTPSEDRTQDNCWRREISLKTLVAEQSPSCNYGRCVEAPKPGESPNDINYSLRAFNHDFFIGPVRFLCLCVEKNVRNVCFRVRISIFLLAFAHRKLKSIELLDAKKHRG